MPKSHPHPKKAGGEPAGEPAMPEAVDGAASDLRAQVAQLAEQVRALGDRGDGTRSGAGPVEGRFAELGDLLVPKPRRPRHAPSAVEQPQPAPAPVEEPPSEPAQRPPSELAARRPVGEGEGEGARRGAVAHGGESARAGEGAPAGEGARAGESAPAGEGARAGEGGGTTFADRSSTLVASVVALAELAAIEIRTGAEIEAAAIRAQSRERLNEPSTSHLLALLERQRLMLAALAAQTDRLERAGAVLRAQIRALEAEREHISEMLESGRRTP